MGKTTVISNCNRHFFQKKPAEFIFLNLFNKYFKNFLSFNFNHIKFLLYTVIIFNFVAGILQKIMVFLRLLQKIFLIFRMRNSKAQAILKIKQTIDLAASEGESCDENLDLNTPSDDSDSNQSSSLESCSETNNENQPPQKRLKKDRKNSKSNDTRDENDLQSADGTVWCEIQPGGEPGRPSSCHNFNEKVGPTSYSKRFVDKDQPSSAIKLLISKNIIKDIVNYTQAEAKRVLKAEWKTSENEIYAFIGILYARGVYGANNVDIHLLWHKQWGPPFFSNAMSRDRFKTLIRFIRFDNKDSRRKRVETDKFAAMSDVWFKFIDNCQVTFNPGEKITIDEQLFQTKARCAFTQYMKSKPDKFGIKFWLAADVKTKYLVNAFPYLGKDDDRPQDKSLGEYVVMKLADPYLNAGRCFTTDNFFTSLKLANSLFEKKSTLVGTMKVFKREVPKRERNKKDKMTKFSTSLYKSGNCTLTVYKSKKNKKVLILSSKHKNVKINANEKKVPETIQYYNQSKFGVDTLDQMARNFTTKSACKRWTFQVFCNMLDLAGINGWILYKEVTGSNISRRDYLLAVAEELVNIHHEQETTVKPPKPANKVNLNSRRTCQIGLCNENKTTTTCMKCEKYVCGSCTSINLKVCFKCNVEQ